ncbi:MAG: class I SAM-dependent methyltransferase [Pseudomonadota bacterium]
MRPVEGTAGYGTDVQRFVAATEAVDFKDLHKPYLDLIPRRPGRILDIGAGIGRDAHVFASMGHDVVAVEPMRRLLDVARARYDSPKTLWVCDSLPELASLSEADNLFDFVLVSAVWHHLNDAERERALSRIARLLRVGGRFALSLRTGPAGGGTHVFPTDHEQTIQSVTDAGFKTEVALKGLPSLVPGKSGVVWSKLVFLRVNPNHSDP